VKALQIKSALDQLLTEIQETCAQAREQQRELQVCDVKFRQLFATNFLLVLRHFASKSASDFFILCTCFVSA